MIVRDGLLLLEGLPPLLPLPGDLSAAFAEPELGPDRVRMSIFAAAALVSKLPAP